MMKVKIIIGKNFGDEGKGLAVDYFATQAQREEQSCLVIRHNGGAQAGHTVDFPEKRFVFHQLSSGSFRNADTFWADTFMPDFYKLPEEVKSFSECHGNVPKILAEPGCRCVYIDDVLINMALEEMRGKNRHGSCGMGINEAVERSKETAFLLRLDGVKNMSAEQLHFKLREIRKEYVLQRMQMLHLCIEQIGEYGELLQSDNVLYNVAEIMSRAAEMVELTEGKHAKNYDQLIFEGAQGLLLDETYETYAPHLTSSRTGAYHPICFLKKHFSEGIPELVYISRAYVTRHGAGPLPYEEDWKRNIAWRDRTNVENPWQGKLRFAPHGTDQEFVLPVQEDLAKITVPHKTSLLLTHLNETDGMVCSIAGNIAVKEWCNLEILRNVFDQSYGSYSPYSKEIVKI